MISARSRLLRHLVPSRGWFWNTWKLNSKLKADTLIEVQTLNDLINAKYKNLRLLDAAYYMPADERKGPSEYRRETIPGYVIHKA